MADITKIFNSRIRSTTDTVARWRIIEPEFIPFDGEIIIYKDKNIKETVNPDTGQIIRQYVPGIKIGDGQTTLYDLPFVSDIDAQLIIDHINNTDIHVTLQEKEFWNNKLNYDSSTVSEEILTLNRN